MHHHRSRAYVLRSVVFAVKKKPFNRRRVDIPLYTYTHTAVQQWILFDCSQGHRRIWGDFLFHSVLSLYAVRCYVFAREIFHDFFLLYFHPYTVSYNTRTRKRIYLHTFIFLRALNMYTCHIVYCLVFSLRLPVHKRIFCLPFLRARSFLTAKSVDRDEFVFYYSTVLRVRKCVITCAQHDIITPTPPRRRIEILLQDYA